MKRVVTSGAPLVYKVRGALKLRFSLSLGIRRCSYVRSSRACEDTTDRERSVNDLTVV